MLVRGGIEVEHLDYPPWMTQLFQAIMPSCGMLNDWQWPDACNVNLYEDGSHSVGWHSDDERLFQGKFRDITILSLSLGTKRKFELRLNWPEDGERPAKRMVHLGNGDLMTMEGMLQKHFQHRVPKEDDISGQRINLTWRWILRHNPRCPAGRRRLDDWHQKSNVKAETPNNSNSTMPVPPPPAPAVVKPPQPPMTAPSLAFPPQPGQTYHPPVKLTAKCPPPQRPQVAGNLQVAAPPFRLPRVGTEPAAGDEGFPQVPRVVPPPKMPAMRGSLPRLEGCAS